MSRYVVERTDALGVSWQVRDVVTGKPVRSRVYPLSRASAMAVADNLNRTVSPVAGSPLAVGPL
jgi:C4-dicarboxylate transporter